MHADFVDYNAGAKYRGGMAMSFDWNARVLDLASNQCMYLQSLSIPEASDTAPDGAASALSLPRFRGRERGPTIACVKAEAWGMLWFFFVTPCFAAGGDLIYFWRIYFGFSPIK
jgi:hypothetical protein